MAVGPSPATPSASPGPEAQLRCLLIGAVVWCLSVVVYAAYHPPEAPLASPARILEHFEGLMRNIPVPVTSPQYDQYATYYRQQYDRNMQEHEDYLDQWKKSHPQFNWGVLFTVMCYSGMVFAGLLAYMEYHCGAISYLMELAEAVYNSTLEKWAAYRERLQKADDERLLREMGEGDAAGTAAGRSGASSSAQAGAAGRVGASGPAAAKKGRKKAPHEAPPQLERGFSSCSSASTASTSAAGSPAPPSAASPSACTPKAASAADRQELQSPQAARRPSDAQCRKRQPSALAGDDEQELIERRRPQTPPARCPAAAGVSPQAAEPASEQLPVASAASEAADSRPSPATPEEAAEASAGRRAAAAGAAAPAAQLAAACPEEASAGARAPATPAAAAQGAAAPGTAAGASQRLVPMEERPLNARERLRLKVSRRTRQLAEHPSAPSAAKPAGGGCAAGMQVAEPSGCTLQGAELLREAEELLSQLEAQELLRQLEAEERKTPASQKRKAKRKAAAAAKDGGGDVAQAQEELPCHSRLVEPVSKADGEKQGTPMQAERQGAGPKREKSPEATPEVVEESSGVATPFEMVVKATDRAVEEEKPEVVVEASVAESGRPEVAGAEASSEGAAPEGDEEESEASSEAEAAQAETPDAHQSTEASPTGGASASAGAKWADITDEPDGEAAGGSARPQATGWRRGVASGPPARQLPPAPTGAAPKGPAPKDPPLPVERRDGPRRRSPARLPQEPLTRTVSGDSWKTQERRGGRRERDPDAKAPATATSKEGDRHGRAACARPAPLEARRLDHERSPPLARAPKDAAARRRAPTTDAKAAAPPPKPPARVAAEGRRSWAEVTKLNAESGEAVATVLEELRDHSIDEILDWFQANDAQEWLMERALAVGPDANGKQDLLGLARELIEEQLKEGEAGGDGDDEGCEEGDQPQASAATSLRAEAPEFVPAPKEEPPVPVPLVPGSPCGNFQPVMCVQGVPGSVPQMMQCQAIPMIAIPMSNMQVGTSAWAMGIMMPHAPNSATTVVEVEGPEAEAPAEADVSLDTPTVSDVEEDRYWMHCPKVARPKADLEEEQFLKPEGADGVVSQLSSGSVI